jgi:putative intracellular protease/amidase
VTLAAAPLTKGGEAVDTLLVAGGEGAEAAAENPVLVDWVRQRATRARRVASVCNGAFLLAAAGLEQSIPIVPQTEQIVDRRNSPSNSRARISHGSWRRFFVAEVALLDQGVVIAQKQ